MSQEKTMPFLDHLVELRTRLIRCFIAMVIGMGVAWHFSPSMLSFVEKPLTGHSYLFELKTKAYEELKERFPSFYKSYPLHTDPNETSGKERKLNYSAPLEPFFIQIKITMIAGAVLAFPVILYQLWLFVGPA